MPGVNPKILFSLFLLLLISPANSAEVLIATWNGKFPSEKAFEKRLKELRPDVKFTHIDAGGKKSKLATTLRHTDLSKFDIVYSFGTTGTKLVKTYLQGKRPQLFNIVSTPAVAKIVNSLDEPGNNITGGKYLVELKLQLELLSKLHSFKTLAVWFDPREKQSNQVLKRIKNIMEKQNIKVIPFRIIPDSNQFDKQLKRASEQTNELDAMYRIGSVSLLKPGKKLHAQLSPSLLVMGTSNMSVKHGATVAFGVDFKERGIAVAEQAHKILSGTPAGKIPVSRVTLKNGVLYLNKKNWKTAGIKNPEKLGVTIKYID